MNPEEYGRRLAEQHMAERPLSDEQAEAAARILASTEAEDAA